MKFLDANIFVYAYYKSGRQLTNKERVMKERAKRIITKINEGKVQVTTTIVHISEAVNILKHGMSLQNLTKVVLGLFMLDNVKILTVAREMYFEAVELGGDLKLDPNDALAIDAMKNSDINKIYSFDADFDKVEEITRLPQI